MKFIDVHCHINESDYGDVDALIKNIQAAGVQKIISAGFDLPSSEYCRDLAEKYDCVYFTAGIHPTELKNYRDGDVERIAELARHKKCVAIGETGLDYHYPDTDKVLQREVFLKQIDLADKLRGRHSGNFKSQRAKIPRGRAVALLFVLARNRRANTKAGLLFFVRRDVHLFGQ